MSSSTASVNAFSKISPSTALLRLRSAEDIVCESNASSSAMLVPVDLNDSSLGNGVPGDPSLPDSNNCSERILSIFLSSSLEHVNVDGFLFWECAAQSFRSRRFLREITLNEFWSRRFGEQVGFLQ
jgi:hypothetical protein